MSTGGEIAWAFRPNSPQLKASLDAFLKTHRQGTTFGNTLLKRYLGSTQFVTEARSPAEMKKFQAVVEMFQKYAGKYNVDFLLMMAQGYQESRLDQKVKSKVGAVGVMQVMPTTGKELGVGDISQLEPNIHAGVKYMRFMIDRYYKDEPMTPARTRVSSRSRPTTPARHASGSCARKPQSAGSIPTSGSTTSKSSLLRGSAPRP